MTSVSFSENGYHLASADASGAVKLWDLRKLTELKALAADGPVSSLAFDGSGKYLSFATARAVTVQDVKAWKPLAELATADAPAAIAFSADAASVVAATASGALAAFGA